MTRTVAAGNRASNLKIITISKDSSLPERMSLGDNTVEVRTPGRRAAYFSACWPVDIQTDCDAMNSCPSHGPNHRNWASDTLALASGRLSDDDDGDDDARASNRTGF